MGVSLLEHTHFSEKKRKKDQKAKCSLHLLLCLFRSSAEDKSYIYTYVVVSFSAYIKLC